MQKHKSFTKPWRRRLAERLSVALCLTMRTQDDARREIAAGFLDLVLADMADASRDGGLLTVPGGNYTLARTVFVTNLCSIEMSPGARIKAVAEMDWMFKINQMWQYNPKTAPKDVAVIRQDGGVLASQR
jgi:hypothetical protein